MQPKGARMGEFEAVADAVTGGMLGRAVEPATGIRDGHTDETNCLNCGTALVGTIAHACGQHAHVHRSLARIRAGFPVRRAQFRRKDLQDAAVAGMAAGQADAALYRWRAGALRFTAGVVPVQRLHVVRDVPARGRIGRPRQNLCRRQSLPFHRRGHRRRPGARSRV